MHKPISPLLLNACIKQHRTGSYIADYFLFKLEVAHNTYSVNPQDSEADCEIFCLNKRTCVNGVLEGEPSGILKATAATLSFNLITDLHNQIEPEIKYTHVALYTALTSYTLQ